MFVGCAPALLSPRALVGALRPQDVFQILTQPANQMQAAINALPFSPDILIDKDRAASENWSWRDSARGFDKTLASNTAGAEVAWPGYSGTNNRVVFALKQQARVAVRVPYTGDGNTVLAVPHGLGIKPGMILIKRRDAGTSNWNVYHIAVGANNSLNLNSTAAAGTTGNFANTEPTDTTFYVSGQAGSVNAAGGLYVALLVAHDPDTTNGIVQCGTFTLSAGQSASVALGWQPQWLIVKKTSGTSSWQINDAGRGFNQNLYANLSATEDSGSTITPTSTGFNVGAIGAANDSFVYFAIRAPIT